MNEEKEVINLRFEINSEITYRLYDLNRSDLPNHVLLVDKVLDTVNLLDNNRVSIILIPYDYDELSIRCNDL